MRWTVLEFLGRIILKLQNAFLLSFNVDRKFPQKFWFYFTLLERTLACGNCISLFTTVPLFFWGGNEFRINLCENWILMIDDTSKKRPQIPLGIHMIKFIFSYRKKNSFPLKQTSVRTYENLQSQLFFFDFFLLFIMNDIKVRKNFSN